LVEVSASYATGLFLVLDKRINDTKTGEQAATEHTGCPALNDAIAIAAGFEPASSVPEVSVAYTTGSLLVLDENLVG